MKAFNYDIEFEQGATYRETFTWQAGKPALPVNLTGCTATARFRVTEPANTRRDITVTLDTASGGIVLGDAAGTVELIVQESVTRNFVWDKAEYQVTVTFPNGDVRRLMQGTAEVSHSV